MKKTTLTKNKEGYVKTPTFNSWDCMKQRCNNPNNVAYKNYGGRGIKYDKRWEKFDNFVEDMGERPENMTLDRINVDDDYYKENCKWSTKREQQHNLRTHKREDVGVVYDKSRKKWLSKICNNYKQYAKRFNTKEEAILWRKEMENELW